MLAYSGIRKNKIPHTNLYQACLESILAFLERRVEECPSSQILPPETICNVRSLPITALPSIPTSPPTNISQCNKSPGLITRVSPLPSFTGRHPSSPLCLLNLRSERLTKCLHICPFQTFFRTWILNLHLCFTLSRS